MAEKRKTGEYELVGSQACFVPFDLPPHDPQLHLSQETIDLYGQAMHKLGRLNEMMQRIPDGNRFLKAYIIKEALLSSEIEGIHTTLVDVFSVDQNLEKPNKETQLVVNYSYAMNHALKLIREDGFPIVSRVICQAHEILLSGNNGQASPGQFRKQPVRVGNLVPPPSPLIPELISKLEYFINEDQTILPLIKAGLAHVQFETIHPFLDGNGRTGRMLIVLMLINDKIIDQPLLYPSYFFKKYHAEYYKRLDSVRTEGDFEGWIHYYLRAINESAHDAWIRSTKIEKLEIEMRNRLIQNLSPRKRDDAFHYLTSLFQYPVTGVNETAQSVNKSYNFAKSLIKIFVDLAILQPLDEQKRHKSYIFAEYIDVLRKDYSV